MAGSVLIIDAEEDFVSGLARGLKSHGLEATATSDGKAGLDLAHINIPSAIVLCAELPRMSGYSICAKLKKDSALKSVPLVITSAEATQETFEHHKKLKTRADEYLRKPFTADDLIDVLERYLPVNGQGAPTFEVEAPVEASSDDMDVLSGTDAVSLEDAELEDFESIAEDVVQDGMLANISDDEVLSAVGVESAPSAQSSAQVEEIARLKERLSVEQEGRRRAERERDLAVANEKAVAAQLQAMSTSSQPPTPSTVGSREVLALKKELNAKEREILELHERLTKKDKELLSEKDRQMELEDQLVQLQDAKESVDRAKLEAEGRVAASEARASEIQRSSDHKIQELQDKISRLGTHGASLEASLKESRAETSRLSDELTKKKEAYAGLETQHRGVSNELSAARAEATSLREQISSLRADLEGAESKRDDLTKITVAQAAQIERLTSDLAEAEERSSRAYQRIREDEETKSKAKKALEIALALLQESGYTPDIQGDAETFSGLEAIDDRS